MCMAEKEKAKEKKKKKEENDSLKTLYLFIRNTIKKFTPTFKIKFENKCHELV